MQATILQLLWLLSVVVVVFLSLVEAWFVYPLWLIFLPPTITAVAAVVVYKYVLPFLAILFGNLFFPCGGGATHLAILGNNPPGLRIPPAGPIVNLHLETGAYIDPVTGSPSTDP